MMSIEDIRGAVYEIGRKINAPKRLLSIPTEPIGDGSYYLEIKGSEYHLVSCDRGLEIDRKVSINYRDILYWIFDDVTFSMAIQYEKENRIPNQDQRRLIYERKLSLLALIDSAWAKKTRKALDEILVKCPFDDWLDSRLRLCEELTSKGFASNAAYEEACKKYPLPDIKT